MAAPAQPLPGTRSLIQQGDLAIQMVEGIDRFLTREIAASVARRERHWKRDYSSHESYARSAAPNRDRFRKIIGLVDERVPFESPALSATVARPAVIAEGIGYKAYAVRWPVLDGVDADGLLLEPARAPVANVVALPDSDVPPEVLASGFARRLAENGCRVIIPALVDRGTAWSSGTNLSHREVIHRMAYQMGRHIAGYEVQKVLAAVDWFTRESPGKRIGVIGHGEGGLVALYSAASDTRIDAAAVAGYFESRQNLWREPLYRNIWRLLDEFGDAELASLVAPRSLVVEACRGPEVPGPPPVGPGMRAAAAPGRLTTPQRNVVQREVGRARLFFEKLGAADRLSLVASEEGAGECGSGEALTSFLRALNVRVPLKPASAPPEDRRGQFDPSPRQKRQFDQLIEFTQKLVRRSESVRKQFWGKADLSSPEKWDQSVEPYRKYLWEEITGKFPPASEPLEVRTRKVYDEPKWTGYDVVIPVWPDVFASGVLLVPKDLRPGERRPVVVCQHGVNRRVHYVVDTKLQTGYNRFAARLADEGFVVYAPQNPYVGEPEYPWRVLQRKANSIQRSLFGVIAAQHERTLDWLATLPFVDASRIGLYGLSYGGETALRVPPLAKRYVVSISSGNFNQWTWKTTSPENRYSFVFGVGYDHYDFNMGNTFDDGDLANLVAPRAFMVERGHNDGVGPDEWVAYEYARVRRHYAVLGIPDRTRIEFFSGGHEIRAVGTFEFLQRHLGWPGGRR
jgi:dienelactone hydrolase